MLRLSLLSIAAAGIAFGAPLSAQSRDVGIPNDALHSSWILSDFDGDRHADLAQAGPARRTGLDYSFEIRVDFSSHPATSFTVHSGQSSVRMAYRDLDGDRDRDLIFFTAGSPVGVWINDGAGHFNEGRISDYGTILDPDGAGYTGVRRNDSGQSAALNGWRASAAVLRSTRSSGRSCAALPRETATIARPVSSPRTANPRGPPSLG